MFNRLTSTFIVGMLTMTAACKETRYTEIYRLPAGFHGWVLIKYGFKKCPPIKREGTTYTFVVPPDGIVCTSGLEGEEPGKRGYWVVPRFYWGNSSEPLPWTLPGKPGGMVWDGGQGGYGDDRSVSYQIYYIGSEEEYLAVVNDPKKGEEALLREKFLIR